MKKTREQFRKTLVGRYGDRRQEFVVIGKDMQRDAIEQALTTCLLTEPEMQPGLENWAENLLDPFPAWEFEVTE